MTRTETEGAGSGGRAGRGAGGRAALLAGSVVAGALLAAASSGRSLACNPDYIPVCGRSAYLAKFVNAVVVNPSTPSAVVVPVGLVPRVEWNDQGTLCVQPTGHSLELTVTCVDAAGGPTVTFGPVSVPMQDAKPTVPGNQPIAGGSPFTLTIPQGTLNPGGNYTCTITGAYTVTFPGGRGGGTIVGTGPTVFSTIEPSPADPSRPLFHAERVSPDGQGFVRARAGDQVVEHYLVANNHPTRACVVEAVLDTDTVARSPQLGAGSAADSVYPISTDVENADRYAMAFAESLPPGALVRRDDPLLTTGTPTGSSFFLSPFEARIVSIVKASHGMCLDGSCSEDLVRFRVVWPGASAKRRDGDLERRVTVGSVTQVDEDAIERNALCSVTDFVSVLSGTDARWSAARHDGLFRWATHGAGNQPEPAISDHSTRTISADLVPLLMGISVGEFLPSYSSTTRFDAAEGVVPDTWDYSMVAFRLNAMRTGFDVNGMTFEGSGVADAIARGAGGWEDLTVRVPLFRSRTGGSDWLVRAAARYEAEETRFDLLEMKGDRWSRFASGTLTELSQHPRVAVDSGIYREFTWKCPDPELRRLHSLPLSLSYHFDPGEDVRDLPAAFTVFNGRDVGDTGPGTATSGTHVQLPQTYGLGTPVGATLTDTVPVAPAPPFVDWVRFDAPKAFEPLMLPVALREVPAGTPAPEEATVASVTLVIDLRRADRGEVTITVIVEIEEGFDPDGARCCIDFGGFTSMFQGDARGRFGLALPDLAGLGGDGKRAAPKGPKQKLKLALKRKGGAVPAQEARLTYSAKGAELRGFLFDEDLRDETVKNADRAIPVRIFLEGRVIEAEATVVVNAKAGKKLTARTRR